MPTYIGKRMTLAEFKAYLKNLTYPNWKPSGVTIHHTAAPSLADRPKGMSHEHKLANGTTTDAIRNMWDSWIARLGNGPHLVIDDQGDGIILMHSLNERGTHATSFNATHVGIEMLGDYDREDPTIGRGKVVIANTNVVLIEILKSLNLPVTAFNFHRDDPKTQKTCPGLKVKKEMFGHANTVTLPTPGGPRPVLKRGSTGDAVVEWQKVIGVTPDGDFGPTTTRVTKKW